MSNKTKTGRWREPIYRGWSAFRRKSGLVKPAKQTGMGARAERSRTSFRVWAPHAKRVTVSGTFNNWSLERDPLVSEKNGYWSATIGRARTGDQYQYIIHTKSSSLMRNDPYAREIDKKHGNSIIRRTKAASQEEQPPWMAPWNELVIYELHLGALGFPDTGPRQNRRPERRTWN